jgi:hypothetical protein
MPRFDGTGPRGQGPRTGRGLGSCGYGMGYGRGSGRGWGLGYGRGWGYGVPWSYRQPTTTEERAMVQDDIAALKEELKAAEERLNQLENQK